MNPQHIDKINFENIKFSNVKNNKGHKYLNILFRKEKLFIHFPKMRLPFGLSKFNNKYSLDLSLDNLENNVKIKQFYDSMIDFETKVCNYIAENKLVENGIYKSCISEKKPFAPLLKCKIITKNDGFLLSIYDHEKKEISNSKIPEIIQKNINVKGIIECSGIWISEKGDSVHYGLSWKVNQIRVYEEKKDVCFIEDSDIDSEIVESDYSDL